MSIKAVEETLADSVARRVRGVMGEARVSGTALAKQLGISQAALSRRTTGATPFRLDELSTIAGVLGVSEAYLLGFTNDRSPRPAGPDGGLESVRHQGLEPRTRWFGASRHLSVVRLAEIVPFPAAPAVAPAAAARSAA